MFKLRTGQRDWVIVRKGKLHCICEYEIDASVVSHMELTKLKFDQAQKQSFRRVRFVLVAIN